MVAQTLFLGENLLPLLILAFGGALVVGNGLALIRPPKTKDSETSLDRAPVVRTLSFVVIGVVMTAWAIASLTS